MRWACKYFWEKILREIEFDAKMILAISKFSN